MATAHCLDHIAWIFPGAWHYPNTLNLNNAVISGWMLTEYQHSVPLTLVQLFKSSPALAWALPVTEAQITSSRLHPGDTPNNSNNNAIAGSDSGSWAVLCVQRVNSSHQQVLRKCSSLIWEGEASPIQLQGRTLGKRLSPGKTRMPLPNKKECQWGPNERPIIQLWALDLPQAQEGPETPRRGTSIHSDHVSFWSLPQDLVSSFT